MKVTSKPGWTEHEGSSHLVRSKYNTLDRTLDVEFKNGSVYRYHGVHPEDHKDFLDAPSQGEHFHQFIKENHVCTQIK